MSECILSEIRLLQKEGLVILDFNDGAHFELPVAYLRACSTSAAHRHAVSQGETQDFSAVKMVAIEPIGLYALRFVFDDGHDTGLYSFTHLYQLGQAYEVNENISGNNA